MRLCFLALLLLSVPLLLTRVPAAAAAAAADADADAASANAAVVASAYKPVDTDSGRRDASSADFVASFSYSSFQPDLTHPHLAATVEEVCGPGGRGLHSSTFRLNVSALCGIGGT